MCAADGGLKALRGLAGSLTCLDATACVNITDLGVEHLAWLTSLKSLKLDACTSLSGLSMQHLSGLPGLNRLGASMWQRIGSESLLGAPRGLTELNLRWCKGLSPIIKLPERITHTLRVLRIDRTRIRGRSLAYILPCCYALETLTLSGCTEVRLTAASSASAALAQAPSLTELDLSDCLQLLDGSIETLASGTIPLARLNVLRCQVLSLPSCLVAALASITELRWRPLWLLLLLFL